MPRRPVSCRHAIGGATVIEPVRVDTVTFTESTDFAALVHSALSGDGGFGSTRADAGPVDWVFRAYAEVSGTAWADRLARGVAACLTAAEPEIRSQALIFFQSWPLAAGGERLGDLAAGDRALFAGVPDPVRPGVDLEHQLLAALAARSAAETAG